MVIAHKGFYGFSCSECNDEIRYCDRCYEPYCNINMPITCIPSLWFLLFKGRYKHYCYECTYKIKNEKEKS